MTGYERHLHEWGDRLQDWLDGELAPAARAAFAAHLSACEICREYVGRFEQLDARLTAALPSLALDASFDARLMARIAANDEQLRATKRRALERQIENERLALARGWRRSLVTVVPSVIAGIAVAFSLSAYVGDLQIVRTLITDSAAGLGQNAPTLIKLAVTSITGAGIGLTIARWLSRPA
jgi:anti-sigma factor RsiW